MTTSALVFHFFHRDFQNLSKEEKAEIQTATEQTLCSKIARELMYYVPIPKQWCKGFVPATKKFLVGGPISAQAYESNQRHRSWDVRFICCCYYLLSTWE